MVIIFMIVGALIGAGFASGQEIYLFFYKYGFYGIYGLILCSILTSFIIYKIFKLILNHDNKIKNYKDFLSFKIKNLYIAKIFNIIINISLLITFFIMISGFGAYFEQEFKINKIIGSFILSLICFCIFLTDIKGVAKVNFIIVPILILFILTIGIFNFFTLDFNMVGANLNFENLHNLWIIKSIIYCSYNMLLLIPILVNIKDYIKSIKQIKYISIFSGLVIFILSIVIFLLLVRVDIDFELLQMPVIYVISKDFSVLKYLYGFVILSAIFTTAISVGISFLNNIVNTNKYFSKIAAIMCIISVIISNFGFSNLVNLSYPIFGILGLVQIYFIIK